MLLRGDWDWTRVLCDGSAGAALDDLSPLSSLDPRWAEEREDARARADECVLF
jgi:hypothetical protein